MTVTTRPILCGPFPGNLGDTLTLTQPPSAPITIAAGAQYYWSGHPTISGEQWFLHILKYVAHRQPSPTPRSPRRWPRPVELHRRRTAHPARTIAGSIISLFPSATGAVSSGTRWPKASADLELAPIAVSWPTTAGWRRQLPAVEAFSPVGIAGNNESATEWYLAGSTMPCWVTIDMGSGNAFIPYSYGLSSAGVPGGSTTAPSAWQFQGSNDNATWTTLDTQTAQGAHACAGAVYVITPTATAYRYYRFYFTAAQSGNGIEIGSLCVIQVAGGSVTYPLTAMTSDNAPAPYIAQASSEFSGGGYEAYRVFQLTTSVWAANSSSTTPWTLQIDLGYYAGVASSYQINGATSGGATNSPKSWTFQGSNDASSWTTLDTQTGHAYVASLTTFTLSNTTAYRYYRLNITALQSSSTEAELAQMNIVCAGQSTAYPTSTMYYVYMNSGIGIDLTRYLGGSISSLTITNSVPSGGTLVGFVSTDGGTTWYYWTGSTWTSIALSSANLAAHGNTMATLQTQLAIAIASLPGHASRASASPGAWRPPSPRTPPTSPASPWCSSLLLATRRPRSAPTAAAPTSRLGRTSATSTILKNQTAGSLQIYATLGTP